MQARTLLATVEVNSDYRPHIYDATENTSAGADLGLRKGGGAVDAQVVYTPQLESALPPIEKFYKLKDHFWGHFGP